MAIKYILLVWKGTEQLIIIYYYNYNNLFIYIKFYKIYNIIIIIIYFNIFMHLTMYKVTHDRLQFRPPKIPDQTTSLNKRYTLV